MAITPHNRHNLCRVKAIEGPFGIHYAKLVCQQHDVWIQWLSKQDYQEITSRT